MGTSFRKIHSKDAMVSLNAQLESMDKWVGISQLSLKQMTNLGYLQVQDGLGDGFAFL
jgi:hypothetical protein